MAAPSFVSSSTLNAAATGETSTLTLSPHQADDIIVLSALYNSASDITISADQGWSELMAPQNNANFSCAMWWKRCTSSSEASPVVTTATASTTFGRYAQHHIIRGCATSGNPFEDATANGSPTTSTTPTGAEIDTTGVERLVACFALIDDDSTVTSGYPPTDWTAQSSQSSSTGGDARCVTIRRDVATASTIAAVVVGTLISTEYWKTLTVAFVPVEVIAPSNTGFRSFVETRRNRR